MNSGHAQRARRPARPRARLGLAERRAAILQAAKALFLKQGYAATSLEQVVAKSGGSLATIYQLFGNKEGLWRELVSQVTQAISAPLLTAPTDGTHTRETLVALGCKLLECESATDVIGGIRLILAEGGRHPELARTMFAYGPDAGRRTLAAYLAAESAAGRLRVSDPVVAAEQFCNLIGGDRLLRHACGLSPTATAAQDHRRVEAVVDMFLRAYAA